MVAAQATATSYFTQNKAQTRTLPKWAKITKNGNIIYILTFISKVIFVTLVSIVRYLTPCLQVFLCAARDLLLSGALQQDLE